MEPVNKTLIYFIDLVNYLIGILILVLTDESLRITYLHGFQSNNFHIERRLILTNFKIKVDYYFIICFSFRLKAKCCNFK
jgi:hypothetical protein